MPTNPKHAAVPKRARKSPKNTSRPSPSSAAVRQWKGDDAKKSAEFTFMFAPREYPENMGEVLKMAGLLDCGTASEEALSRCLEILEPAEHERQSCCRHIASLFYILIWRHANPEARPAKAKNELLMDAQILRSAATLLRDKPYLNLFVMNEDEGMRTSERLASIASVLEGGARTSKNSKKQTKPPNRLKLLCARGAHDLLQQFSGVDRRPTLSVDGAFHRLASVLYEAATGKSDVALERWCRTVLHSHRRLAQ
jgi:hypothetical protein